MTAPRLLVLALLAAPLLSGCGNVRQTLGMTRNAPDEFAVTARAPLEMPQSFDLPAPAPGATRPQDHAAASGESVVLGAPRPAMKMAPAPAEDLLVERAAGATAPADPAIRATLSREDKSGQKPGFMSRLMQGKILSDDRYVDPLVDAPAEAQRLEENKAEGRKVNEGEVPTYDPGQYSIFSDLLKNKKSGSGQ